MNIESLKNEATELITSVKSGTANTEQVARLDTIQSELKSAFEAQKVAEKGEELLAGLAVGAKSVNPARGAEVKSLGDHVTSILEGKSLRKEDAGRFHYAVPEFRAASDVVALGTTLGTRQDVGLAPAALYRPTVASLFPQGETQSTSIEYLVEGAFEGDFAGVAEAGHKPQLSISYDRVEEKLGKLAGFIKETDEFASDRGALRDAINGRLIKRLQQVEEAQLINGNGTAGNVNGILNRSGLLTVTSAAKAENLERIYEAISTVEAVTGYAVDGIAINPADYRVLRLAKNSNNDYYAGGPFDGAGDPGLWGRPTVVSAAVPAGTVLVGAFGTAGMVWRNGGVSLDVANQNGNDFEYNLVTVRAEERVGLAVYLPSAFARVTLSNA